jgi:hypothetical protein
MLKPKKSAYTDLQKSSQPEVFPPEVEHLLDVLARIEARRQLRLRALELGRKSVNATSETPS